MEGSKSNTYLSYTNFDFQTLLLCLVSKYIKFIYVGEFLEKLNEI